MYFLTRAFSSIKAGDFIKNQEINTDNADIYWYLEALSKLANGSIMSFTIK